MRFGNQCHAKQGKTRKSLMKLAKICFFLTLLFTGCSGQPTEEIPVDKVDAVVNDITEASIFVPATDQSQPASQKPVPQGKPQPVEPQQMVIDKQKELQCTIVISAATVLNNMDRLDPAKAEILPPDGVIMATETVAFYEGETVFDVLLRVTKDQKIHMEFTSVPMYNSKYIEGINNLYEFDCGELSGWMYKVNGWFPNYGSSRYQLSDGDRIEWLYTCDLGRDIGGEWEAQKQ